MGKLQSGQGWIALDYTERIEGEKQTQSESSGMNIQEIQTGNFSSVKGSWRNAQGNSITFDANGLTQVNGNPAGDVVLISSPSKEKTSQPLQKHQKVLVRHQLYLLRRDKMEEESIFGVKIMSVMVRMFIIESRRIGVL